MRIPSATGAVMSGTQTGGSRWSKLSRACCLSAPWPCCPSWGSSSRCGGLQGQAPECAGQVLRLRPVGLPLAASSLQRRNLQLLPTVHHAPAPDFHRSGACRRRGSDCGLVCLAGGTPALKSEAIKARRARHQHRKHSHRHRAQRRLRQAAPQDGGTFAGTG